MTDVHRPAVRVICFDTDGRVLLLNWRDPVSGACLWEPPGGGIDPGETPLQAARRELAEETGLDPCAITGHFIDVQRDAVWKGARVVGTEQFFTAFFPTSLPTVARTGLLPYEQDELQGHQWVHPDDFAGLPGRLEPPSLAEIVAGLR